MASSNAQPVQSILRSFMLLIGAGTVALKLPFATPPGEPISWIDSLFTSTSAACVTGLVVRDTGTAFTPFGQGVILLLIELGGLGVMTFSLLVAAGIAGRLSLAGRQLIEHTIAGTGAGSELWPLLRLVFAFTAVTELIGAIILFVPWQRQMGTAHAAYAAVFHSVSAFCNAGFSLWSDNLMRFHGSLTVNLTIMALIVLGGLGFLTIHEIRNARGRFRPLSLHSKLVLTVTAVLIVGGAALFRLAESGTALSGLGAGGQAMASFFQSVTARTAGFNTVDIARLTPATLFVLILLMYVGGSPGSTAGGVKTTTLGVLACAAWSRLRNRQHVNAFRRTISPISIQNTLTIALAGVVVTLVGVLVLLLLEQPSATALHERGVFIAYLFETVSALNTVGLSVGITPELSPAARVWVSVLMFVGRLGPLTFAAALISERPHTDWQYPSEDVGVG
jgi:trk system potassium uptake protein TrkH